MSSSVNSQLAKDMQWLGAAGLMPFMGLPFMYIAGHISKFETSAYFVTYSAIILSFLGGIHWWDAYTRTQSRSQLYIAMLPSIAALFLSIAFSAFTAICLLALCFLLQLIYDLYKLEADQMYRQLRSMLTGIVIGCHFVMLWLLW